METIIYITFWLIFVALSIGGAYFLLQYLYGDKDPRKWKPILFSNFKRNSTIFSINRDKGKLSKSDKINST